MLVNYKNKERHFPDILILGAAKSGTTSLAYYLKQHPDVYMPRKEPGFFAYYDRPSDEIPSGIRDRQIVDPDVYTEMYREVKEGQKICDASVAQFTNHRHTLRNIRNVYGEKASELKTFVILRNPVDRAYSHYQMFLKNKVETMGFEEALNPEVVRERRKEQLGFDYIGGSLYAQRITDILEKLPQTEVYLTEDLKQPDFLERFLNSCGLRTDVEINTSARLNPSGVPKRKGWIALLNHQNVVKSILKKSLSDKALFNLIALKSKLLEKGIERVKIEESLRAELLEKHFRDDLQRLEKVIGRDLSKWYEPRTSEKVIPSKP
jgi:hypothetical protein